VRLKVVKLADWVAKKCVFKMRIHSKCEGKGGEITGDASPTFWSRYANFKSLLFISLEIDCFHGV
jgi:hypothetical protein